MRFKLRLRLTLGLCVGAAAGLAACQQALPAVPVTRVTTPATTTAVPPTVTAPPPSATQPAGGSTPRTPPAASAAPGGATVATATATPLPATRAASDTPTPGALANSAATASSTTAASITATASSTAAAMDTPPAAATPTVETATAEVTAARATFTPTATGAPPPLYTTTGGPAGYSSHIQCQQAGAPCAPVMPPGDLSFRLSLASDASAPWTHFVNYGLSVERNGANMAELFMFVDAGWLQPGAVVGFGASRVFTRPGAYVIRSSGCLTTAKTDQCGWATMAGDVVSFTIAP